MEIVTATSAPMADDDDDGIIRCICGFTHDDGFTIQCEKCLVWQHAVCVGITKNSVPDEYYCEQCFPRDGLDPEHAKAIQRKKFLKSTGGGKGGGRKKSSNHSNHPSNINTQPSALLSTSSAAAGGGGGGKSSVGGGSNPNSQPPSARRRDSDQSDFYDDFDDLIQEYIPTNQVIVGSDYESSVSDIPVIASNVESPVNQPGIPDEEALKKYTSVEYIETMINLQRVDMGVGVFANTAIKADERIGLITGSFVSTYDGGRYTFPLKDGDRDYALDCRRFGNEFRFIRVSGTPNCVLKMVKSDEGRLYIWIEALVDIEPAHELLLLDPRVAVEQSGQMRSGDMEIDGKSEQKSGQGSNLTVHVEVAGTEARDSFEAAVRKELQTFKQNAITIASIQLETPAKNLKKLWTEHYVVENPDYRLFDIEAGVGDETDLVDDSFNPEETDDEIDVENVEPTTVVPGVSFKQKLLHFKSQSPAIPAKEIFPEDSISPPMVGAALPIKTEARNVESGGTRSQTESANASESNSDVSHPQQGGKRPANEEPVTRISLKDYKKKRKLMDSKE